MAWPKTSRKIKASSRTKKLVARTTHRRSGAHKGMSKRVNRKLFRGRTVNAPKKIW